MNTLSPSKSRSVEGRYFDRLTFILEDNAGDLEKTILDISQYNPRGKTWSANYLSGILTGRQRISRFMKAAIIAWFKAQDKDPPLPIWIGRARKEVRKRIYKIPPARRLEVLEKESDLWR